MTDSNSAIRLMTVGFLLMSAGWVVLLLMVIGEVSSTLSLSFGAYGASVAGLSLGLFGAMQYARGRAGCRPPEKDDGRTDGEGQRSTEPRSPEGTAEPRAHRRM